MPLSSLTKTLSIPSSPNFSKYHSGSSVLYGTAIAHPVPSQTGPSASIQTSTVIYAVSMAFKETLVGVILVTLGKLIYPPSANLLADGLICLTVAPVRLKLFTTKGCGVGIRKDCTDETASTIRIKAETFINMNYKQDQTYDIYRYICMFALQLYDLIRLFNYRFKYKPMEQTSIVLSKQQKNWNKQLSHHIEKYSYLRDWSELASWLSKTKSLVNDYKGSIILEKQTLLKKLATSLNGSLPVALHEATLQIFQILFAKNLIKQQIGLACLGIFSFFSIANMKNKQKVVEIFIKQQLRILATGLLITILPSLTEMHQQLVKEIYALLQILQTEECLGHKLLMQSVWISILRSGNCRVAGLKYITSKLGRGFHQDQHDQQDNFWNDNEGSSMANTSIQKKKCSLKDTQQQMMEQQAEVQLCKVNSLNKIQQIQLYCPHIQTVVVNGLISCVQDSNTLTIKAALDFLYKYLPLRSQIISHKSKMKLSNSIIWLLGKRDMSVTRKINLWLFGKPNIDNKFDISKNHLQYVVQSVGYFLKNVNDQFGQPLKIVINLYNEHQQLPALSLQELANDIMNFAFRNQQNQEVQKLMQRLIDRVRPQLHIMANSLGKCLLRDIQQKQFKSAMHNLKLILHLLHKMLKHNQIKQLVFSIMKVIMMSYQKTMWKDQQYMRLALEVTLDMLDKYKDVFMEIGEKHREDQTLKQNIGLYIHLVKQLSQDTIQGDFQNDLAYLNKLQVKINQLFGVYDEKWVQIMIQAISLNTPQYYMSPIQIIGQGLQREGKLKDQLMKRSQEAKDNYIEKSITKLWNIISLAHLQGKAIPLLLKLVKYFPHMFSQVLDRQFSLNTQMCITKFSLFWKLSPKYPTILTQQHLAQICKEGLFRMLDFLDNGNPLIKYNTNIWVNDSFPNFYRVLDPLLQIMLKPKDFWYQTPKGQYVYAINPDNLKLQTILKQLLSVLKHTTKKFYEFAAKPVTTSIMPYLEVFTGKQSEPHETCYLEVIFQVVIRYTMSKYVCVQNPGIDLLACDILETLIKNIKDPALCAFLLKKNLRQVLSALHFATINQEHLLQIQLLQLLKIIFFQSVLRKAGDKKFMIELIGSPLFVSTILEGLDTSFPYIKQRFVQFITSSIPLFLEYHPQCSQLVSRILNLYTTKIMVINSKKMEAKDSKDIQISRKNVEILVLLTGVKDLLSYFLNLQIKQFEKQKSQTETDSGVFSLYSWKSYMALKLQRRHLQSSRAKKCAQQIARQISNQLYNLLLTLTSCWSLSELSHFYKLDYYGLSQFYYEEFHSFNKQLYLTISKYETEESVEAFIINLMRVLINKYPKQVMGSMVHNWTSALNIQSKLKIIQMLNMSSVPVELFYNILADYLDSKQTKKKKSSQLQVYATNQIHLLHFCQTFTHYNFQNFSVLQASNLVNIWQVFLRFLKTFENSRNALTLFAMVQLLDLFIKKNNPKQILRDQKIRKDISFIALQINQLISLCGGKTKIVKPAQSLSKNVFLPYSTSIFQVKKAIPQSEQKPKWMAFDTLHPDKVEEVVRIMGLTILKRVGYFLLQTFHGDTEANLVKKVRDLLTQMLSMVQDKSLNAQLIQGASQIVLTTLQKKHIYLKQFKNDILSIFNKDDFFIVSSKTLHCWVKIIDMIIDSNKDHDIFSEYLEKVSLATSIFTSNSLETKKKTKSFERICFILYSGKKDKYIDKTHLLVDKIIEVIKANEAPQPVLILIFFCIRILILRVTPEKLTKLLSNVWQQVMFLLMNIFKKVDIEKIEKDKNELNLVWAALKLVEMVSIMQMNEFHPHQWLFFYDFVGIKFSISSETPKLEFNSKPLINRFLPNVKPYRGQVMADESQGPRHLLIKEDKIDDLHILMTKALLLSSYLVASNENKMKFEMQQIQELIQKDFLNLDQFILKLK